MRDHYPTGSSVPEHCLVPPELQPEFLELEGCPVPDFIDLGSAICAAATEAGRRDQIAVIDAESGRSYTFAELDEISDRFAWGLRTWGVGLGDRIAFRSHNVPEVVVIALAVWKAGGVIVPTPAQARADELAFFLDDTGSRLLLVGGVADLHEEVPGAVKGTSVEEVFTFGREKVAGVRSWHELLEPAATERGLPRVPSDSPAIIWHTGGTTGQPKAVYHTHRRMILASHALARATGVAPGERWSAAAPMGHALGFASQTFWPLLHGASVVVVRDFASPEAMVVAVDRHRVNGLAAIMVSWARMLEVLDARPELDVSSLTHTYAMWQSAASSKIHDRWMQRGIELLNNFGCTAFASWILAPGPGTTVPRASIGQVVPGYEVIATDLHSDDLTPVPSGAQGRLAVRGVSGLTYWNRPELQRRDVRDGWVLVDDVVAFDAEGNATYLGRTDFIISTAGYKVAPVEVEEVLARHDAVSEVGVVGAPDPVRQEIVTAFVVVTEGAVPDQVLNEELQAFAKANLAPYKYPRRVVFVDQLPRDHVGKLQPRVLREWAADAARVPA